MYSLSRPNVTRITRYVGGIRGIWVDPAREEVVNNMQVTELGGSRATK